jgi:hypothetical protein
MLFSDCLYHGHLFNIVKAILFASHRASPMINRIIDTVEHNTALLMGNMKVKMILKTLVEE